MICPRCGQENIDGVDRCGNCLEPFRDRDVPHSTEGFQRLLMEEAVIEVGATTCATLPPDATVSEAIRQMKRNHAGCVLVVADDLLVGIFTERDLMLKVIGASTNTGEMALNDVMTRAPETVEPGDSLRFAMNKMSVGGFRHIPIASGGRVVGMITAKDLLRFLARKALGR